MIVCVVVAAACGGSGNNDSDHVMVDAPPARVDARVPSGNAKSHTLYVNTEGAMLAPGADDATMNKSGSINAAGTPEGLPRRVGHASDPDRRDR